MLVTVTLYDAGPPTAQISGPAMIKTLPSHPLQKVCCIPTLPTLLGPTATSYQHTGTHEVPSH